MRSATTVGAEDATQWLLTRLRMQEYPTEVIAGVERLLLTEGGVRAIETARVAVQAAEAARTGEAAMNVRMDTRVHGCAAALQRYSTPHPLARLCAVLGMGENAGDPAARIDAVSGVAMGLLASRAVVARAQARQRNAALEAQACARAYAAAQRAGVSLLSGTEARSGRAAKAWDRVAVLDAKTLEYDAAAGERKDRVRESGVDVNCTHEAVGKWAKQVRALRSSSEADKAAAEGYLDLPPDVDLARERVREVREQLALMDRQIQEALKGFVSIV